MHDTTAFFSNVQLSSSQFAQNWSAANEESTKKNSAPEVYLVVSVCGILLSPEDQRGQSAMGRGVSLPRRAQQGDRKSEIKRIPSMMVACKECGAIPWRRARCGVSHWHEEEWNAEGVPYYRNRTSTFATATNAQTAKQLKAQRKCTRGGLHGQRLSHARASSASGQARMPDVSATDKQLAKFGSSSGNSSTLQ